MKIPTSINLSLRILIPLASLLIAVALIFVTVLYDNAPRIKVLPQIFNKEPMRFNQFVEATNLRARLADKELIDEMLLRFYVEKRHTKVPDFDYLEYAWGDSGPVARLSTGPVYRAFIGSKGDYLEDLKDNTNTTTVDIVEIKREDRNTFRIDFDIYGYTDGHVGRMGARRAMLKVDYYPNCMRYATDFANPFCMVVKNYDETGLKK